MSYQPLVNQEAGESVSSGQQPGSHGEGAPMHMPMGMPMAMSMSMPMPMMQQPLLMHQHQQHQQAQQPMLFAHPLAHAQAHAAHAHGQTPGQPMQMQPFPYPLFPMQMPMAAGGMPAFPPGTVLYAMPQPAYTQQPLMLAKPADLDSSSSQTPAWPSFVAMQTVQPPLAGGRQEAQSLVAGANAARWRDSDPAPGAPMSPAVFDKRKRILWCILMLSSIVCAVLSAVAVGSPSSIFTCSPFYSYSRSTADVRLNFGYFKYCSTATVIDFKYSQSTCGKYAERSQYNVPLPQVNLVSDGNTKTAQAFAIMAVASSGLITIGFLFLLKAQRVRPVHVTLALLCCFNILCQALSLALFVTKTSQISSGYLFGCKPLLLSGGIFQIVVAALDFLTLIFTVLLAVNKISFVGIFKKTQANA